MSHTPGPWIAEGGSVFSDDATGSIVATCDGFRYAPRPKSEVLANAEFIVRVCNSHAAMLEALKDAQESLGYLYPEKFDDAIHEAKWTQRMNAIQQAIAQAEGRTS